MRTDEYALITGATSGIGFELAKLFAADGWNLIIVARSISTLESVQEQLERQYGINVVIIQKDLFLEDSAQEVYAEANSKGVRINALVNNAGQGIYGEFIDTNLNRELAIIT